MKKYKVSVYAISKNEEKFVDRWMDAVSEADEVVVLDTGSTDNTVEKLRARGAKVYEAIISPWRFDTARNMALEKVSVDTDICVSNDLDEVFEKGWREKLERSWKEGHTNAKYTFVWPRKDDSSILKSFPMEKIHIRHGYRWVHPVHEVLEYIGEGNESKVYIPDLLLYHYPDENKSREQYLPLLELSVKENPTNDRATFWLGREYMYKKKYNECIETLKKHISMPNATWDEERSASMRFIAHCYKELGNITEAKAWLFRAIAECQHVREPYLALARFGYSEKDWPLVYVMVKKALEIKSGTGSYLNEPECFRHVFYDLGSISAYYLGLFEEAKTFAEKALELNPESERIKNNLLLIEKKLNELKKGEDKNE